MDRLEPMSNCSDRSDSAFKSIKAIDYTVVFVRDMDSMRQFYEQFLYFPIFRELSQDWLEYRIGKNTFVLARPKLIPDDIPAPMGNASLQLAFKVSSEEVDECANELERRGIELLSPSTDRDFGHRTMFFRDPDGNVLELFAEI